MTHEQAEKLREIARDRDARARNPLKWAVWCLCNHTANDHGLLDYEATGKIRAHCTLCTCDVFQEDPLTSPFADSDSHMTDILDSQDEGLV